MGEEYDDEEDVDYEEDEDVDEEDDEDEDEEDEEVGEEYDDEEDVDEDEEEDVDDEDHEEDDVDDEEDDVDDEEDEVDDEEEDDEDDEEEYDKEEEDVRNRQGVVREQYRHHKYEHDKQYESKRGLRRRLGGGQHSWVLIGTDDRGRADGFLRQRGQALSVVPAGSLTAALVVVAERNLCADVSFTTMPLVFAPDDEFVGTTWRGASCDLVCCLQDLHFGSVVFGFASNQFSPQQKHEIKNIIATRLGEQNARMSWCKFEEAKGEAFTAATGVLCVRMHMVDATAMETVLSETHPHSSQELESVRGMSCTVMDRWKPVIYFNSANWNNEKDCVRHFANDMAGYRAYLVMHEMYHAIGFRVHIEPESLRGCDVTRPLPVLAQQTRAEFAQLGQLVRSTE